jgi:Membrane-bound serine protease (ClpP class)
MDSTAAFLLSAGGVLGIYLELIRPGRVIPGVLGGVLAMAGLSALPQGWSFLAAVPIFWGEAKLGWYGISGAAVTAALAIRQGVAWAPAIGLSIPFGYITVFLLKIALRARANKATL